VSALTQMLTGTLWAPLDILIVDMPPGTGDVQLSMAQRVPLAGKKGFMLNLSTAMNSLCDNTAKALDDLGSMMASLANGDMSQRIATEYQGMFNQLKNDANMMAERIGATIGEIKQSAREVTNASAEISTSTTDLSQRTEEQAASLEQTSASMEEISATVKRNAENAQQANKFASDTREVAGRGGEVVAQAVDAMARIEESSRKVSDIIEFESELRLLSAADIDEAGLKQLTGIDTPVVNVLEQNMFYVNEVMRFGKLVAVIQSNPADANSTIATVMIALAVSSNTLETKKKYQNVPVLRNLVPSQVLLGYSSFNTGQSISAGLPSYVRNRIKAIAEILDRG